MTACSLFFLWSVKPTLPVTLAAPPALASLEKEWPVLALGFVLVTVTGILYNLNFTLLRLYQGYPWAPTWIGVWRQRAHQARWQRARDRRDRGRRVRDAIEKGPPDALAAALREAYVDPNTRLSHYLNVRYPYEASLVLPTALGNAIRNFEEYSSQRYGASAVRMWPRLLAKVDAGYAARLDDAKLAVDFSLNASFLCAVSAALALWFGITRTPLADFGWPLAQAAAFGTVSWAFYLALVARAADWGELVKASFDLYRRPLLEALGYAHKPQTLADEKRIWARLVREYAFPDTSRAPLPYAPELPTAPSLDVSGTDATSGLPLATPLVWARGVSDRDPQRNDGTLDVLFEITNPSPREADIRIVDPVAPDWAFVWGSAASSGGPPEVTATQPVTLSFSGAGATYHAPADVPAAQSATLTCWRRPPRISHPPSRRA